MRTRFFVTVLVMLLSFAGQAFAQVADPAPNPVLAYEGRLLESGTPVTGVRAFTFSILDSGGNELWNSGPQSLMVTEGIYGVILGATGMPALPSSLVLKANLQLQVIADGVQLSPNIPLIPALQASVAPAAARAQRTQPIEGVRPPLGTVEFFTGYSNMQANTAVSGARLNLNGYISSMSFYWNDWGALVAEVGVYRQGSIPGSGSSLGISTYQAGPRARWRRYSRVTPFAEVLIGAGHAGGTLYTRPLGPGLAALKAQTTFIATTGGGVDVKLTHRIAIRLVQAEYQHSNFLNGYGKSQNSFRFSTGLNFYFGYYY